MAIVMALEFQARGHSLGFWVAGFAVAGLNILKKEWRVQNEGNFVKSSITLRI